MVCNSLVKPPTALFSKSANAKSTIDCLPRIFKNKTSPMDYPKTKTFAQRDHAYGVDKRKYQRYGSIWLIKKWWIRWRQSWFCCQVSCCLVGRWSLFIIVDKQRHRRPHSKTLYWSKIKIDHVFSNFDRVDHFTRVMALQHEFYDSCLVRI